MAVLTESCVIHAISVRIARAVHVGCSGNKSSPAVTVDTGQVCYAAHVDVDFTTWHRKGAIHGAMLDAFTTATEEVTLATVVAIRHLEALQDVIIGRSLRKWQCSAGTLRVLLVCASSVVTDETVDCVAVCVVKAVIAPANANMAAGAAWLVGYDCHTEIIDDIDFANGAGVVAIIHHPCPVRAGHDVGDVGVECRGVTELTGGKSVVFGNVGVSCWHYGLRERVDTQSS